MCASVRITLTILHCGKQTTQATHKYYTIAIFEFMRNPVTNKSKSPAKHRESKNGNLNAKNSSQVAAQLAASQIDWDKIPVAASTPRKSSLGSTSSSTRDSSHESLPSTSTGRKRSISDRLNWKKPTSTKTDSTTLDKRALHDARLD